MNICTSPKDRVSLRVYNITTNTFEIIEHGYNASFFVFVKGWDKEAYVSARSFKLTTETRSVIIHNQIHKDVCVGKITCKFSEIADERSVFASTVGAEIFTFLDRQSEQQQFSKYTNIYPFHVYSVSEEGVFTESPTICHITSIPFITTELSVEFEKDSKYKIPNWKSQTIDPYAISCRLIPEVKIKSITISSPAEPKCFVGEETKLLKDFLTDKRVVASHHLVCSSYKYELLYIRERCSQHPSLFALYNQLFGTFKGVYGCDYTDLKAMPSTIASTTKWVTGIEEFERSAGIAVTGSVFKWPQYLSFAIEYAKILKGSLYSIFRSPTYKVMRLWWNSPHNFLMGYGLDNDIEMVGGSTVDIERGLHSYVHLVDFKSCYPNIIRALNISHEIDGSSSSTKGIVPGMVEQLMNERAKAVALTKELTKDSPEHIMADCQQRIYKLLSNIVFGCLASAKGTDFSNRTLAIRITEKARLLIAELSQNVMSAGLRTIQMDTDGVMVRTRDSDAHILKKVIKEFCALHPEHPLEYKSYYPMAVLLDKKCYILTNIVDSLKDHHVGTLVSMPSCPEKLRIFYRDLFVGWMRVLMKKQDISAVRDLWNKFDFSERFVYDSQVLGKMVEERTFAYYKESVHKLYLLIK